VDNTCGRNWADEITDGWPIQSFFCLESLRNLSTGSHSPCDVCPCVPQARHPIIVPAQGRGSDLKAKAKSLFRKILRVSLRRSRFCRDQPGSAPPKLFEIKILRISVRKTQNTATGARNSRSNRAQVTLSLYSAIFCTQALRNQYFAAKKTRLCPITSVDPILYRLT
jgi:hypothetical protein